MNKRGGFGKVFGWLFVFVVGSLIVTFLVNPNSFNDLKQNIKGITSSISGNSISNNSEDPLLIKCRDSFNRIKDIAEQKYDVSISLLQIQRFEDEDPANNFFNTWKSSSQYTLRQILFGFLDTYGNRDIEFPIVLIAISIRGDYGQIPKVVVCETGGDLSSYSKNILLSN